MFDKTGAVVRRCFTVVVVGMAACVATTDAAEFIAPHFSKPISVGMMIGWAGYLLMKWAEINFSKK